MITINKAEWKDKGHTVMTVIFSNEQYKNMPFGISLSVEDSSPIYKEIVEKFNNGEFTPDEYVEPQLSKEDLSENIKDLRAGLLNKTDKYMTLDFPLSDEDTGKVKQFRQQLRDITKQTGFPYNVKWPTPPDCIKDQISIPS